MSEEIKILLVEDAKFYRSVIKSQLEKQFGFEVLTAETFAEADQILNKYGSELFLALLDLNLPDAPNGEIVDHVLSRSIPSIVFSGHFNEELRDDLMQKRIIDYVLKDSPASIDYVISIVKRVYSNRNIKVLIVDDSQTARFQMHELLDRYKFIVLQATNGLEGIQVLHENPDISLIITDYNMPKLDGFEFTKKVRTHYSKREISIIGVSTYGNHSLSAKFLKIGANDFITKPFLNEEFFCRVLQNVEMIDYIRELKNTMYSDYLTGLSNRRYLYEFGNILLDKNRNNGTLLGCVLIDVDDFKSINETYGHDVGDMALKHVSSQLKHAFQDEEHAIVCRFSGEEFVILCPIDDPNDFLDKLENLKITLAQKPMQHNNMDINVTACFGATWLLAQNLDELLNIAGELLKEAKLNGPNKLFS